MTPLREEFATSGRIWFRSALSETELSKLERSFGETTPGTRLSVDAARSAGHVLGEGLIHKIHQLLPDAFPRRFVFFSKNESTNWGVGWHQDRVIAVRQRAERSEFQNWSNKNGVPHCEAPLRVLSGMLFLRIHFDDTAESDGAMEIARGSHTAGLVRRSDAAVEAGKYPTEFECARRGDVLALKMLTLHRSAPSGSGKSRRVLRVDFASEPLPQPLQWYHA